MPSSQFKYIDTLITVIACVCVCSYPLLLSVHWLKHMVWPMMMVIYLLKSNFSLKPHNRKCQCWFSDIRAHRNSATVKKVDKGSVVILEDCILCLFKMENEFYTSRLFVSSLTLLATWNHSQYQWQLGENI